MQQKCVISPLISLHGAPFFLLQHNIFVKNRPMFACGFSLCAQIPGKWYIWEGLTFLCAIYKGDRCIQISIYLLMTLRVAIDRPIFFSPSVHVLNKSKSMDCPMHVNIINEAISTSDYRIQSSERKKQTDRKVKVAHITYFIHF